MNRAGLTLLCVLGLCTAAGADYIIAPLSNQAGSLSLLPGESFDLDIVLSSDAGDGHISSIFRVEFSQAGLVCQRQSWQAPYSTGSVDDLSIPGAGGPALPYALDADVLSGLAYPVGVVDMELTNVTDTGSFGAGTLVTLGLLVPEGFGEGVVTIGVVPDTFDTGLAEIPTTSGPNFTLTVVPEPATAGLLIPGAWLAPCRRRKR